MNQRFTISSLSEELPEVSCSVLYEIVDVSVKTTVLQWLSHQAANFYDKGIKNLVVQYKCLNIGGNYVEKWIKMWTFM